MHLTACYQTRASTPALAIISIAIMLPHQPSSEVPRLAEIACYDLALDERDAHLDDIVLLLMRLLKLPMAGICVIGEQQIWLKSHHGIDVTSIPRDNAFCDYAIGSGDLLFQINDAKLDARFVNHPMVNAPPHARFYCGIPLITQRGYAIGTLFGMDVQTRQLSANDALTMLTLGQQVLQFLESKYCSDVTNLPNRHAFVHDLQHHRQKNPTLPTLVGFINIQNFRMVNQSFGRAVGDQALRLFGARLSSWAEQQAMTAHLGGDKFTFACYSQAASSATQLAQLLEQLAPPFLIDGQAVTLSLGIGLIDSPHRCATTALAHAEAACAEIDHNGSTSMRYFNAQQHAISQLAADLNRHLSDSDPTRYFVPVFQAQINFQTGKLIGLEALVRWQHPSQGCIMPARFIALAENSKLIFTLDLLMMRTVCRHLRNWLDQGLPVVPISTNFSRITLMHPEFLAQMQQALHDYQIPPDHIEAEITESSVMHDAELSHARLLALKQMGIRIALDDFGTGYSNLVALKSFNFDRLKIDRQFIDGVAQNQQTAGFFHFIHGIAEILGVDIMCEGVEQACDVEWLRQRGVGNVQGWYFSHAQDAASIPHLLHQMQAFGQRPYRSHGDLASLVNQLCPA